MFTHTHTHHSKYARKVLSQILMDKINYGYEGLTPTEVVASKIQTITSLPIFKMVPNKYGLRCVF